jgi:hypothetical protein
MCLEGADHASYQKAELHLAHMGRLCFWNALQIVDFYHSLEPAGKVLATRLGRKEHPEYQTRPGQWAKRLLHDQVAQLIVQPRQECVGQPNAQAAETELTYFVNNVPRMQYGTFRRQGLFIGSDVIEGGGVKP